MKYNISCAVVCNTGNKRSVNQDNFWCMGNYLDVENKGLDTTHSSVFEYKRQAAFAVFDGMGGEKYGEKAAYIAANVFNKLYKKYSPKDVVKFLHHVCMFTNKKIVSYASENRIRSMGTTSALIMFKDERAFICNVGDSKVFCFNKNKLSQISVDHVLKGAANEKMPLSQNLGIPETEFIIEPYIAEFEFSCKNIYLLCTDGLTDMISQSDIENILSDNENIDECAEIMLKRSLANGGNDNITIIICKFEKQKESFASRLFRR